MGTIRESAEGRRGPNVEVREQNRINLRVLGRHGHVLKHGALNINEIGMVAPTGPERTYRIQVRDIIAR